MLMSSTAAALLLAELGAAAVPAAAAAAEDAGGAALQAHPQAQLLWQVGPPGGPPEDEIARTCTCQSYLRSARV